MIEKEIDTSLKLDDLELIKCLKNKESIFLPIIIEVNNNIKSLLETGIPIIFSNYTLHNIEHSYRVIKYMGDILPNLEKLNELEIAIIILVGLLHDIGMAVSNEDLVLIKTDKYPHFKIKYSAVYKYMDNDENLALQEFIRKFHSQMSGIYIKNNFSDKFKISGNSNISFEDDLIKICQSHTEKFDWISQNLNSYTVKGEYDYNSQFISHLLRIGDILDIDEKRTPLSLYNLIKPKGKSNDEWMQSFVIQNYEKIEINPKSNLKRIAFHGKCSDAHIHRKLLLYFDWVQEELTSSIATTNNMLEKYRIDLDDKIYQNITAEGYSFSDYKMKLDFKAISSLLMGEKIYGSKNLGLRELIQNSIDACKYRKEIEYSEAEFGEVDYEPKIKISVDKEKKIVSIKDNGIGMSLDIIKNHFLNIGKSYYNSSDFLLQGINYKPIGNYGIGFLACFMLSKVIKINTRFYDSTTKYTIELEMGNEYTSILKTEDVRFEGTEVIFNCDEFISVFKYNIEEIKKFVTRFFLTDDIRIELIDVYEKKQYKLDNVLANNNIPENGILINLSDYLIDLEGYAIVKLRDNFVTKLEDIDFNGDLFIFDEEDGLQTIDDYSKIDICDYKNHNKINYFNIPIIDASNEINYLNGLNFTDGDIDEVINKISNDVNWISIIYKNNCDANFIEEIIEIDDYIGENFEFCNLVELGHSEKCNTKMYNKEINIFEGVKNKLYLPFEKSRIDAYYNFFHKPKNRRDLFVRNVLIKDFRFNIGITASIIDIKDIVVNVKSKKVVPDVSRNNLDRDSIEKLNYSIGKAIHLGVVNNNKLSDEEQNTVKLFINEFYAENNEFIK